MPLSAFSFFLPTGRLKRLLKGKLSPHLYASSFRWVNKQVIKLAALESLGKSKTIKVCSRKTTYRTHQHASHTHNHAYSHGRVMCVNIPPTDPLYRTHSHRNEQITLPTFALYSPTQTTFAWRRSTFASTLLFHFPTPPPPSYLFLVSRSPTDK